MGQLSPEQAANLSLEFAENPRSYQPIELTKQGFYPVVCMHPTGFVDNDYGPSVQTGGGGAGLVIDSALAHGGIYNADEITFEQAVEKNNMTHRHTQPHIHKLCALIGNVIPVLEEIVEPSEFSVDNSRLLQKEIGLEVNAKKEAKIRSAASRLLDSIVRVDPVEHVMSTFSYVHPKNNVQQPDGENRSVVYNINTHPLLSKDDRKKPDTSDPQAIQMYHDGLGATVLVHSFANLPREERELAAIGAVLRSASTQTKITAGKLDNMHLIRTRVGAKGLIETVPNEIAAGAYGS
jgi:hypothetical protein